MSGHTKKHHIKLEFGDKTYSYSNVPSHFLNEVLSKLNEYEDEESINWRDTNLYKKSLNAIGGIPAFRESAMMIKASRHRVGMTQVELAKKLKTKQNNISIMENAKRGVGKRQAMKLAKIFKVNYKVFLSDLDY